MPNWRDWSFLVAKPWQSQGFFGRHDPCYLLGMNLLGLGTSGDWKSNARTITAVLGSVGAVVVAVCFFLYPGVRMLELARDPGIHQAGQPNEFPVLFRRTAQRYRVWAEEYLASHRAASIALNDVAGTEWPLFGTVFFLLSADELIKQGKLERDDELTSALNAALRVLLDPSTANWVKAKWGKDYATHGNVFYRMLVLHGLTSFESATQNTQYHAMQQEQARLLAAELTAAPYHLADDYPGECYPNDVLWAVVAIKRALGPEAAPLVSEVIRVLDGKVKTRHGVPAFSVNSETAKVYEGSRGSTNSGSLSFAGELDAEVAERWYAAYTEHHWSDGIVSGFREVPVGEPAIMDVDSGPVILGMGSVASLFGIGAARANGRFDHASQLALQVLALSWPTPFGLLLPGVMGWLAADGWCFGELALSFALTRPTYTTTTMIRHTDGTVPPLVWIMTAFYFGVGTLIFVREARYWRTRLAHATLRSA